MLQIRVESVNKVAGLTARGKLTLVDLAGSERVGRSGAIDEKDRLGEAININQSLSTLGNVIANLQRKASHIPYRDSKLTYLLSDSLGGDSKMLMFVQIAPTSANVGETINALEFAMRANKVELGKAKKNVSESPSVMPRARDELQYAVAGLEQALSRSTGSPRSSPVAAKATSKRTKLPASNGASSPGRRKEQ